MSKRVLNADSVLLFFVFAVLANVAYCAAYIPDLFIQFSTLSEAWSRRRWLLLAVGLLFSMALTYLLVGEVLGVGPNANGNW